MVHSSDVRRWKVKFSAVFTLVFYEVISSITECCGLMFALKILIIKYIYVDLKKSDHLPTDQNCSSHA